MHDNSAEPFLQRMCRWLARQGLLRKDHGGQLSPGAASSAVEWLVDPRFEELRVDHPGSYHGPYQKGIPIGDWSFPTRRDNNQKATAA